MNNSHLLKVNCSICSICGTSDIYFSISYYLSYSEKESCQLYNQTSSQSYLCDAESCAPSLAFQCHKRHQFTCRRARKYKVRYVCSLQEFQSNYLEMLFQERKNSKNTSPPASHVFFAGLQMRCVRAREHGGRQEGGHRAGGSRGRCRPRQLRRRHCAGRSVNVKINCF